MAEEIKDNQAVKINLGIQVNRKDDNTLFIDIDGCETLDFEFKKWEDIEKEKKEEGFVFGYEKIKDEKYRDELSWASGFCKTQFAKTIIAHKIVADLIKSVVSKCEITEVGDEGDYYHTGVLEHAENAIVENGKLIDSITGQLQNLGWGNDNIKTYKNETNIKKRRKDK